MYAVLFVTLSFYPSARVQDYSKSNQPISLKLGIMTGAPVPDTDSGLLFRFPHHCGIGDFRRFIIISHTVTGQFYETWRND